MGPEATTATTGGFTDKVPPSFNGRDDYASYREDVLLWVNLTGLEQSKQGAALVGRLSGEAKASAKTISVEKICADDGVDRLLTHLDKSYAVDAANQLDADLAGFLDYTWEKNMTVEQYIAGFHTRLDKIATLNIDNKLKGHLLLRQATLLPQDRNMLIGAASGSYEVSHLTAAMRNAFINQTPNDASMTTQGSGTPSKNREVNQSRDKRNENRGNGRRSNTAPNNPEPPTFYTYKTQGSGTPYKNREANRSREKGNGKKGNGRRSNTAPNNPGPPTFYTYKTSTATNISDGAVLDSGACASVVGKKTLDKAIQALGISRIPDGNRARDIHRFGDHPEEHPTICAVKFPFSCIDEHGDHVTDFNIAFDVIDGKLPFLIGLPSLLSMRATLNFMYKSLGLRIGSNYIRIPLNHRESHIELPFKSTVKRVERDGSARSSGSDSRYTTTTENDDYHSSYYQLSEFTHSIRDNSNETALATSGHYYYTDDASQSNTPTAAIMSSGMYIPESSKNDDRELIPPARDTYRDNAHTDSSTNIKGTSRALSLGDIQKLHVQLKHAAFSQMRNYVRSAGLWNATVEAHIRETLAKCRCRLAFPPKPHAVVGPSTPMDEVQTHLSVDVIRIEGNNYLHCVDRVSGWSEVGLLRSRGLEEQAKVLRRSQFNRHGIPRTILSDREYNKGAFQQLCDEFNIQLIAVPAHAHQSNGSVERANRTLRSYFDRLRICDQKSPASELVQEAAFGKNINRGNRLASSFELVYSRLPRPSGSAQRSPSPPVTLREYNAHIARRNIRTMLRTNIRDPDIPNIGDEVFIWRDDEGWLGPAPVTKVDAYGVEVMHNGRSKSASMNRVRTLGNDISTTTDPAVPEYINSYEQMSPHANLDPPLLEFISGCDDDSPNTPESRRSNDSTIDQLSLPLTQVPNEVVNANDDIATPDGHCNDRPQHEPQITAAISNPDCPQSARLSHPISDREIRELVAEKDRFLSQASRTHHRTTESDSNQLTYISQSPLSFESTLSTSDSAKKEVSHGTADPSAAHASHPMDIAKLSQERKHAYDREYRSWVTEDAFSRIDRSSVPTSANIIGSHTVYRRKQDGSMKARIVPWGHRDEDRDKLRSDSPCANLEIFRLILSFSAEHSWTLAQMDISTAFLQALGFNRDIFVRPPKEASDITGLWKLNAAAYGLVDSGRLWYRTSDHALVSEHGLTRSRYEPTLYYWQVGGKLVFALVAQVDNYIYTGTESEIISFEKFLQYRFKVGALDRRNFSVMGCEIEQDDNGSITLTQRNRLQHIDEKALTSISHDVRSSSGCEASAKELHAYRSVIGKMLYVGRMSQPIMLYHASHMASKVSKLQSHHLKDLRALLRFDKKQVPALRFLSPSKTFRFSLEVISDASMSPISEGGGRGGFVIIRRSGDISHPLHWCARKLRRVARSSSTAELLAASDAASSLIYFQHLLMELTYHHEATMVMDSRALVNLATSIREPTEAANKVDLAFIRENFKPLAIRTIAWTPGYHNIADGLTKDNRTSASLLLRALRTGIHPHHPDMMMKHAELAFGDNRLELYDDFDVIDKACAHGLNIDPGNPNGGDVNGNDNNDRAVDDDHKGDCAADDGDENGIGNGDHDDNDAGTDNVNDDDKDDCAVDDDDENDTGNCDRDGNDDDRDTRGCQWMTAKGGCVEA